ncbi:TPA: hypothetical protein U1V53_000795 [Streptococcus suis]|nr:hypothetical protein [Streptococcus suis]HEM3942390.1 hypothetical protein [Streptococcus suis]HEM3949132.1 hypothetical protein [Streptococcus suis]HEM3952392.1 hypothetical protein [Streptococcus suis]HEM3955177.1 hypothetical protein [Streptococcus suis]
MRVVRKGVLDTRGYVNSYFYGLEVIRSEGISHPVYPYASSREVLEEFVNLYYEELASFFDLHQMWFTNYLLGFDTSKKEEFKDRWFDRGLLIM